MTLLSEVKTIAVIGAGQMGSGIAQVAAQTQFQVILCDNRTEGLNKAIQRYRKKVWQSF